MSEPRVVVTVPPAPEHIRIIRIVSAMSASTTGFGLDRMEDLGLAVDEAAGSLLALEGVSALECSLAVDAPIVHVTMRGIGGRDEWPPEDWQGSLEAMVLTGVADDVRLGWVSDAPSIDFRIAATGAL